MSPLPEILARRLARPAAILGDGRVALIIDPEAVSQLPSPEEALA